jgi:chromosome segregation ATPase
VVNAEVAEQPFPKPKLNNYLAESSNSFKWIVDAPEFAPGEASSATSASNSNPAFAMTGENPSLHLQGPLALLTAVSTGNESYGNPLQNDQPLSLTKILNMNMEPWVRKMATELLDNGWPAEYAPHPGPYPTSINDAFTGQWSLELQEWTQKYIAWQEGQRGEVHIRHRMCVRGWNDADQKVRNLNRNMTRARRRLERAETALKTARQEMEQANQDALADANVQKETIAKLEEEVAQLKAEKDQLAGVGGQTEAIDRLQKQVSRLEEENEKLTQDEPTLGSKVERLTAQLKDANETNRTLEDALAKQAEEKKRGAQSPESSSRLQPPPARKEICTHEAEFATLREEIRNMHSTIIAFGLSASQADFELNQAKEKAADLAQILREQLSFARNSVRQFNRANETLRAQKSHLETALHERLEPSKQLYQKIAQLEKALEESSHIKAKIQAELRDLKTKYQLETGGLQARIIHLEHGIHTLSEDKKLDDEDKCRLEHEINCLKREYERKITDQKENESHSQALKDGNTQPKATRNKNKKKGKGQPTQPAAPEKADVIVRKQESKQFDEVTLWEKLKMVVCVVLLLLLILVGWMHWRY